MDSASLLLTKGKTPQMARYLQNLRYRQKDLGKVLTDDSQVLKDVAEKQGRLKEMNEQLQERMKKELQDDGAVKEEKTEKQFDATRSELQIQKTASSLREQVSEEIPGLHHARGVSMRRLLTDCFLLDSIGGAESADSRIKTGSERTKVH